MIPTLLDPSLFPKARRHVAHRFHTQEPRVVSRRGFLGRVAGGAGVLVGASMLGPGAVAAPLKKNATPKPIPGGFEVGGITFHVYGFGRDQMPSSITDFNGFVGVAQVQGTGTATNPDGTTETLLYDTDMRFMKGVYVGLDERMHQGTFSFI